MIFVQDSAGTRLDIMLADTPYDILAIERGREIEIQPGMIVNMCTPEDLIIYKSISTRQRDQQDIQGIMQRQGDTLDDEYVLTWLCQFEEAFDDSPLVDEYIRLRGKLDQN